MDSVQSALVVVDGDVSSSPAEWRRARPAATWWSTPPPWMLRADPGTRSGVCRCSAPAARSTPLRTPARQCSCISRRSRPSRSIHDGVTGGPSIAGGGVPTWTKVASDQVCCRLMPRAGLLGHCGPPGRRCDAPARAWRWRAGEELHPAAGCLLAAFGSEVSSPFYVGQPDRQGPSSGARDEAAGQVFSMHRRTGVTTGQILRALRALVGGSGRSPNVIYGRSRRP